MGLLFSRQVNGPLILTQGLQFHPACLYPLYIAVVRDTRGYKYSNARSWGLLFSRKDNAKQCKDFMTFMSQNNRSFAAMILDIIIIIIIIIIITLQFT